MTNAAAKVSALPLGPGLSSCKAPAGQQVFDEPSNNPATATECPCEYGCEKCFVEEYSDCPVCGHEYPVSELVADIDYLCHRCVRSQYYLEKSIDDAIDERRGK